MSRNINTRQIAAATDWKKMSWSEIYSAYCGEVTSIAITHGFLFKSSSFHCEIEGQIDCFHKPSKELSKNALVVISGTHGVEGPAGSFVQMMMAQDEFFLDLKDTSILFIHALNPWGYKNGRRVNENNIDINRNSGTEFVTHFGYDDVHSLVMPENWDEVSLKNNLLANSLIRKKIMGGQYDFPNGVFYGGTEPSWSVRILEHVCNTIFSTFEKVSVLDIHTGLGEWGKLTTLSPVTSPDDSIGIRTKNRLSAVEFPNIPKDGNLVQQVSGDVLSAMIRFLPNTEVTPVALEFGTMPIFEYFPYFIGENWVYHNPGRLASAEEREIREKFWELFYPSENRVAWLDGIWEQSKDIAQKMVLGMSE